MMEINWNTFLKEKIKLKHIDEDFFKENGYQYFEVKGTSERIKEIVKGQFGLSETFITLYLTEKGNLFYTNIFDEKGEVSFDINGGKIEIKKLPEVKDITSLYLGGRYDKDESSLGTVLAAKKDGSFYDLYPYFKNLNLIN